MIKTAFAAAAAAAAWVAPGAALAGPLSTWKPRKVGRPITWSDDRFGTKAYR